MKNKKAYESIKKIEEIANGRELPERLEDLIAIAESVSHMAFLAYSDREREAALMAVRCMAEKAEAYLEAVHADAEEIREAVNEAVAMPEAVEMPCEPERYIRQDILDALLPAIRLTRAGNGVKNLTLKGDELVEITFDTGSKLVSIAGDSGIAMIRDVCRALA